jgi:hypothetical protein
MNDLTKNLGKPPTWSAAGGGAAVAENGVPEGQGARTLQGWLASWCDPEWPLCVGFLLLPALVMLALGQLQRASFFAGMAVYLGVLKWVGWAVLTRKCPRPNAFLLFPAEVLAGLAVLCFWFYVRSAVSALWPASYGLQELAVLSYLVAGIHLLGGARQVKGLFTPGSRDRAAGRGELLRRGAFYGPFVLSLLLAFWRVSGVLHVQTTDPIHNGTTAKVYLNYGIFYNHVNGGGRIVYPSGFGAINAVAATVAPLTVVQVINLQHPLLLVVGVFLLTGTVAALSGRPLPLLHSLPLAFLSIFPLYCLYPCLGYESPGRHVAPALLAALCLLPVLASADRPGRFYALLGVEAMLALLTVALNPSCAVFAVPATLVAVGMNTWRGVKRLGQPWLRVLGAQALVFLAAALLVLGCDQYYGLVVRGLLNKGKLGLGPGPEAAPSAAAEPPFSVARGLGAVPAADLAGFTREISTFALYPDSPYRGWQGRFPQRAVPWLALGLGLAALALARRPGRRPDLAPALRPLAVILVACGALWLVLKPATAFLCGGLSPAVWDTALLRMYVSLLAVHCELLLTFLSLAAAGTIFYLAALARCGEAPALRPALNLFLAAALLPYAVIFYQPWASGDVALPSRPYWNPVQPDDVRLVSWIDTHLPPEKGLIGMAATTAYHVPPFQEKHIYPLDGAQALLLYGKHFNCCFSQWDIGRAYGFDEYTAHVRDRFDPGWCLENNVRYFYIPKSSLQRNPGLARAIAEERLRPLHREGSSAVYEVVADGPAK